MKPVATDAYTNALIDAAEEHATAYDGDDRECIKTDVMNAFYAGAAWAAALAQHERRALEDQIRDLEHSLFAAQCQIADLERYT